MKAPRLFRGPSLSAPPDGQDGHPVARLTDDGRLITVLDLGSSKIACVMAMLEERPGAPPVLRVLGSGRTQSAGIRAGLVADLDAAEQSVLAALAEAERQAGVRSESVMVTLGCGRPRTECFVVSADTPGAAVTSADLDRARAGACRLAEREGRALLHLHELDFRIDDTAGFSDPVGLETDHSVGIEVAAVTASRTELRAVETLAGRLGLTLGGLLATSYASGLAVLTEDERDLGACVIDMGGDTTGFAVFQGGHLLHADALPAGGSLITIDLAKKLAAARNDAERIKAIHGTVQGASSDSREFIPYLPMGGTPTERAETTRSAIREIVVPRVTHVLTEIRSRLAAAGLDRDLPGGFVLTGGASQMQGLTAFAPGLLGGSVRLGVPAGTGALVGSPELSAALGALAAAQMKTVRLRQEIAAVAGTQTAGRAGYVRRVGRWLKESFWDESAAA